MKQLLTLCALALLCACNNKKQAETETATVTPETSNNVSPTDAAPASGAGNMTLKLDGKEITLNATALVSKDDKNLQPGLPWFAMVTGTDGPDEESLTLNFVFDLKPGTYPVVGVGLNRGSGDNGQVFGGLLGGEPKLTEWKVNLSEVKNLGSNNLGGNRWSLSGTFEAMTVPAMAIMLIDKEKNHPKEVQIHGGSFTNISFDDNWEELMNKAFDKMKDNE